MSSAPEHVQTVAFMRHGVARHNVPLDPQTGKHPDLHDPAFFDSPLIFNGKVAAVQAGEDIRSWWKTTQGGASIDLIITSPLTRCIQTTVLAFLPGEDEYEKNAKRSIICLESLREACGMHYPDKRREVSVLQRIWPLVTFDSEMTEQDLLWRSDNRETYADVKNRVLEFLSWLVQRCEDNIIVVTHGVWIEVLFNTFFPQALDGGRRRVYNCDGFAGQIVSQNGRFIRLENVNQICGHFPK